MPVNLRTGVEGVLDGETSRIELLFRKNPRARRYILRINAAGIPTVTIPRGGSLQEAGKFAQRHVAWLEVRLKKFKERTAAQVDEQMVLFKGEPVALIAVSDTEVSFGAHSIRVAPGRTDWRARLKEKLWRLAKVELPPRVAELAAVHGLSVNRVSVRDQRSRWGSCSVRKQVSLNWRLIQVPDLVRDYIIVHELMHLREMNHSSRFWRWVHEAFPQTSEAERWLKVNASVLRQI
ncbi:MAG: metal-dependent hydrolase [Pedosphaera sp.]|nr:metal-dependent hydrolase [Pedosphaera sp.]